jgi:amino acid adenylation domain-containing protein
LDETGETVRDMRAGGVHDLVDATARTHGEDIALVDGTGQQLTYAQLLSAADAMSGRLVAAGVGRGHLVGICMARSAAMIVALLAVHRAGAAYVPLDPNYPRARLAFMVKDSGCKTIVCDRQTQELCASLGNDHRPLVLDRLVETAKPDEWGQPAANDRSDLSHIIYTSGSTGTPKAVCITHHNVLALLDWAHATFDAADFSGLLGSTSICFDLSVFEIFATLTAGGRLFLVENLLSLDDAALRRQDIRLINTVPSVLQEYLRIGPLPASLQTLCAAGEPFPGDLLEDLLARGIGRVFNLYGPSEDTTYSTAARLGAADVAAPPIGMPLPGTQAHILDDSLQRCAAGDVGELFLAGDGVACGYLGRGGLTAQRFLPNPFSETPGARMYRTGDLVRLRPDGALDYKGRSDAQFKLHGFRIEAGEIESVLRRHPEIGNAAVTVKPGPMGDRRLVGYVTSDDMPNADVLRALLGEALPAHMIPSLFVQLDKLPRLENGKTDRAALPDPEWPSSDDTAQPAPTDPLARLHALWRDAAGAAATDRAASFFSLGGSSLAASRLIARIRAEFGVDVRLSAFFESPTLANLEAMIKAAPRTHTMSRGAANATFADDRAIPVPSAQRQMWFLSKQDPESVAYAIPAAIRLSGAGLTARGLQAACKAVLDRHPNLRAKIAMTDDGHVVQRFLPAAECALVPETLPAGSDDPWSAVERIALALADHPHDVEAGDLLRWRLLQGADKDWWLALSVHHAMFDEWSLANLASDLQTACAGAKAEPLPMSFADYCRWTEEAGKGPAFRQLLQEWVDDVSGVPPVNWPDGGSVRPVHPGRRIAGSLTVDLPGDLDQAIRTAAGAADVTPYVWLLSVFQIVLHEHTGQNAFTVGTAVAGRTMAALEPLIGCFTNTLPIPARLDRAATFSDLVATNRAGCFAALSRSDVPLEAIINRLRAARDPGAHGLVRVAFGVQNGPPLLSSGDRVRVEAREFENPEARLDLTLWVDFRNGTARANWTYDAALFTPGTVERFDARMQALARQFLANPQTVWGDIASAKPAASLDATPRDAAAKAAMAAKTTTPQNAAPPKATRRGAGPAAAYRHADATRLLVEPRNGSEPKKAR